MPEPEVGWRRCSRTPGDNRTSASVPRRGDETPGPSNASPPPPCRRTRSQDVRTATMSAGEDGARRRELPARCYS
jgi:hypothetical protein